MSLAILLSASQNPAVAQMLGLYFADATTVEGQSYDYTLVADYRNAANGNINTVQSLINAQNFSSIDAYRRIGVVRAASPPLAPPDAATLQAYALPLPSVPPTAPGDAAGLIGVRWGIDRASDQSTKLAPTDSILFHVWRKDFGRPGPGAGEGFDPASFTRLTSSPIAPGLPRVEDPPAIRAGRLAGHQHLSSSTACSSRAGTATASTASTYSGVTASARRSCPSC